MLTWAARCSCCRAARRSHRVVISEAPKAPKVIRTKFDTPEADGMRSIGRPDRVIDTSGMKKQAMAMPWMICGMMMLAGVMSVE